MFLKTKSAVALLVCLISASAMAAIVQYDDRAAWEAAIAGETQVLENFEGFTGDTSFATPVAIANGMIQQTGDDAMFRNVIDVPPLDFADNNGTAHASCYANAPETGTQGTQVTISFTEPVKAWGADFNGILGAELVAVDVSRGAVGTLIPANQDQFLGFVATAGEQITSVVVRTQNVIAGGTGEGFGMDNITTVEGFGVPTLGETALVIFMVLLAGSAMIMMRRNRNKQLAV